VSPHVTEGNARTMEHTTDSASHTNRDGDHWRAVSPATFRWANWDAESLLFHGETGETHILNALPTLILLALSKGEMTTAEILALCLDAGAPSPQFSDKIHTSLQTLSEIELVELAASP
jgi:PqqD family protein of HPr-rel-A system